MIAETIGCRLKREHLQLLRNHGGFTLVELLIAFIIAIVALAGVTASFRTFTKHSSTSLRENEKNSAIESTFQLLKRDLNMAGFGLVPEGRLAEDNLYETAIESDFTNNYDCDTDGDSNDPITELCLDYDLDNDGSKIATSYLSRDRLYIADGWRILEDITDNGAYDGNIVENPIDYYYMVANKKEDGGYFAQLTSNVNAGATTISVNDLNVNRTEEVTVGDDFKADTSVILYGQDSSAIFSLEGLPVQSIAGTTISFISGESLASNFDVVGPALIPTKVVPAIAWYVEQKTGDATQWLYRNREKVLPGVIGFRTDFGYDEKADGLQWFPAVPPVSGSVVDTLVVNNTNLTTILKSLRAVRLVLTIKKESNDASATFSMRTYEKTILLKN